VAATSQRADKAAQWATAHNGEQASIQFDDIIYKSDTMANAVELAKRFAKTDENILITGESGTGKEYFAQAIHNYSSSQGPFMSINCAAIPHRLIESELFGYEPGTFTGAQRSGKAGKIELAHGGTLFLDEIGDMPLELQATLLRVLENKLVMRLGGKSYKKVDFRVVAATNRNLMAMVADGLFREDLFYRLSILTIDLPPLRERQDDLSCFIQRFLDESQRRGYGGCGQQRSFSPDAIKLLTSYSWPGNVRQLRNVVVSTYYASQDLVIGTQDLPAYLQVPVIDAQNMVENSSTASLSELEEIAIKTVLERTGYNVAQTAKQLGVSKATLYRKLKEYNLLMAKRS
jgi:transcriptional regulator with PAS, ATPase and Fis domain